MACTFATAGVSSPTVREGWVTPLYQPSLTVGLLT